MILYNNAYMYKTMDRIVLILTESTAIVPMSSMVNIASYAPFRKRERFFAGISGLNLTRSSNRSYELKFYLNEVYDFQLNSSGVKTVDLSILSTYVVSCPASTVYRMSDNDCLSNCLSTEFADRTHSLAFCRGCHYSCLTCWDEK